MKLGYYNMAQIVVHSYNYYMLRAPVIVGTAHLWPCTSKTEILVSEISFIVAPKHGFRSSY